MNYGLLRSWGVQGVPFNLYRGEGKEKKEKRNRRAVFFSFVELSNISVVFGVPLQRRRYFKLALQKNFVSLLSSPLPLLHT